MKSTDRIQQIFEEWYDSSRMRKDGKLSPFPTQGTLCVALVILERLKKNFDLKIDSHVAKSGTQITGLSASTGQAILARYGERRQFSREWGRTSRGSKKLAKSVLKCISRMGLEELPMQERNAILDKLQKIIADRMIAYLNQDHIKFEYDAKKSARQLFKEIIEIAKQSKKDAAVAQYMVGAKLQLRFPQIPVSNESLTTSDIQSGRQGDFKLGDTVFHVTVNPGENLLLQKCKVNIQQGYKVYIIVPDEAVATARFLAEKADIQEIVAIESLESFLSQNIEELSEFKKNAFKEKFVELINLYNQRVDEIETNKSVMIDVPENMEM